ncbi:MAG: hypothetical protein ACOZQL_13465 [Myxococcota bacterium]
MRRLAWWGTSVVLSGCVSAVPLAEAVQRAGRNEVAAVSELQEKRVIVSGRIDDLSFERASEATLETRSLTRPVPTTWGDGERTVASTRVKTTEYETPFAELTADGATVRCYFDHASVAAPFSVGQQVRLSGLFRALRRTESGALRFWLESCAVAPER